MFLWLGAVFADGEEGVSFFFFKNLWTESTEVSYSCSFAIIKMNAAPLLADIWHLIRNNIGQLLGPLKCTNSFTVAFSILISPIVLHFMPRIQ